MKPRDSVISKLWRKLFPAHAASSMQHSGRPARLDKTPAVGSPGTRKQAMPVGIEMLEGRIAPATLINPTTLVYTDIDGDRVTVKFSKALFDGNEALLTTYINNVFKFSTGPGSVYLDAALDPGTPQQLQSIDLTKVPTNGFGLKEKSPAAGVSFSVIAEKADTLIPGEGSPAVPGQDGTLDGDGFANVGSIIASSSLFSFGLGKVTVDGDLGQIDAGAAKTKVGVKSLKVHSLGAVEGTQGAATGNGLTESKITGELGSLTVETDIVGAKIYAANGSGTKATAIGKIGNITIGGSLIGGSANDSGLIRSDSSIGKVNIGSGADDGIIGGGGSNSGSIIAITKLESVVIDGSIIGGGGGTSGSILSTGKIGTVTVTGDVRVAPGAIGGGSQAASIVSIGSTGKIVIGGDLIGGLANNTGTVNVGGNLGSISIGGDVQGVGPESGGIQVEGKLGKAKIEGSLLGGTGFFSGYVNANGGIGSVTIGEDVKGNQDAVVVVERTGIIASAGSIGKVTIGGSLIGGDGRGSGAIEAGLGGSGGLGSVTIAEQILGGVGDSSGVIISEGKIGSVVVNSSGVTNALQGGLGHFSGSISSAGVTSSVKLLGTVAGGDGGNSGTINGFMKSLSISGDLQGGKGAGSGSIQSQDNLDLEIAGDLGAITISGKLLAGEGARSGAIYADGNLKSAVLGGIDTGEFTTGAAGPGSSAIFTGQGLVKAGDVGTIRVLGAIDGRSAGHTIFEIRGSLGTLEARGGISNGEIHVGDRLGTLKVGMEGRNPVVANVENVLLTAGGIAPAKAKAAVSIASISINGDVSNSQILAGYDVEGEGTNADAQIGNVKVTGNWTASSLVAGIAAVNGHYGDSDDEVIDGGNASIVSRIANVLIGGTVSGTDDPTTDNFGFVAQQIGTFRVAGELVPNVAVHALATDVTMREVSA